MAGKVWTEKEEKVLRDWAYWVQYRWDRRQWKRKGVHHGRRGVVVCCNIISNVAVYQ
jgi:hypothetical protein